MQTLGVAVIGAGFWANEMHLPVLTRLPGVQVVGLASASAEHARSSAQRFNIPRWTTDYRQLLADPAVDVVDILTPNALHAPMSIDAARAGKHILCIKPLALNLSEARQVAAEVEKAGIRFFYAENVPFIPALARAQEIMRQGALGKIFRVKACEGIGTPPNQWLFDPRQSGGGAIIDMAVHSIAFCRWMAGAEAVNVYAQAGTFVHADKTQNEDTAVLVIRFQNEVIGQCEDSWSLVGAMDSRFEVYGTGGRILVDNLYRQPVQVVSQIGYPYWGGPVESGKGWTFPLPLAGDINDGQFAMLEHFINCIRSGEESRSGIRDGAAVLAVVEAAYRSLQSGASEPVFDIYKELE